MFSLKKLQKKLREINQALQENNNKKKMSKSRLKVMQLKKKKKKIFNYKINKNLTKNPKFH